MTPWRMGSDSRVVERSKSSGRDEGGGRLVRSSLRRAV
jgi:hypothetical protein